MLAVSGSRRSAGACQGQCRAHWRGFALLELLAVVAIAAVVLGVTLPSLGDMLRSYRLRLAAGELLGAIELTRGQAIATGRNVMLAPSEASLAWPDGWTVFVDNNGNRRPDPGDVIVMRSQPLAPGISIDMHFGVQQGPPYLAYNSAGRGCSHNNSLAPRFGTLNLVQGDHVRRIKINMLGRPRLCDPARDAANCTGSEP